MNHINLNFEIEKAKKLTKKGNVEKAIKIYENIVLHYPKNSRVLKELEDLKFDSFKLSYDQILTLYNEKKYDEALILAEKLLTANSESYTLLSLLGAISLNLKDTIGAKYYFNQSISINPHFADAYNNLGLLHMGFKEFEIAVDYFHKAVEVKPDFTESYKNLGKIYKITDKPSEAIEYYKKAFETNKKDISSINEVGLILKQYEKYDEAMSYFDKAISIYPNYVSYGNRGNNKAAMGDFDGAIKDLKIALTHNDKSAECWNNIGSALNEKGLPSEALPYLNKAIELNPDYSDAYNNLGIANEFLKNREVSIGYFKKSVEIDPTNDDASTFLSYYHFTNGEYDLFKKRYKSRLFKKKSRQAIPLNIAKPYYEAESLNEKNIVLYDEQGIGDEIFFVSLLDEFRKNISNNITIVCSDRAKEIFNLSLSDVEVFTRKEINNLNYQFDYEMPIGSCMEFIDYKNNPIFPFDKYLEPSKVLKDFWKKELKRNFNGKIIGICWKGGKRSGQIQKRTIQLKDILKNLPIDGNYINLQYGDVEEDILEAEKETGRKIINFSEVNPLSEIDHQFAIISNLDHVITVQGTTVHMAGALSIPTTTLLSVCPDFRYLNEGKKSFFYKSVENLRQTDISDWKPVLKEMQNKFKNYFDK